MSKFFFGWQSLRDNVECFIQCHNYALPFIVQNNILAVPFLCEVNTFMHIVFFINLTKYVYL